MISNQDEIDKYETYNKIYIPTNYKNANWTYRFNGDYIIITTNQNCIQQYNTTYCNCYSYNYKNNVISQVYSCNTSQSTQYIEYTNITDDINYSDYITNKYMETKIISMVMIILGILLAIYITKERKHL